jgi:predicted lipoprotein with Yx(FWY)xxD motif
MMKRLLALAAAPTALAVVAVILAGCGGGSPSATKGYAAPAPASTSPSPTVATAPTKLGNVLVDRGGRTLYLFEKDKGPASSCYGACATIWPPLSSGATGAGAAKGLAGSGLNAAKLGSIRRTDGRTEVTYAGHPLYTYAGDAKPGDVQGQGLDQFGAEWYVLAPSGNKIDNG